nr:hypothetical protein [Photobacterium halotolerans]
MYLYKNHYSVYYGRVCAPKRLVALGFPFDFKFSLETKERAIAVRRSQPIISAILLSLDNFHPDRDSVKEIRAKVVLSIQSLKQRFCPSGIKLESTKPDAPSSRQCDNKVDKAWQQAFIESKNNAQILAFINSTSVHGIFWTTWKPTSSPSLPSLALTSLSFLTTCKPETKVQRPRRTTGTPQNNLPNG